MKKIFSISMVVLLLFPGIAFSISDSINVNNCNDEWNSPLDKAWVDQIMYDIMIGKIDVPPGATEVKKINISFTPTAPSISKQLPNNSTFSYTDTVVMAGYQCYGGYGFPSFAGQVCARTNDLMDLTDNGQEWIAIHQWGNSLDGHHSENVIAGTRYGNVALFWAYVQGNALFGEGRFPANHMFEIAVRPQHSLGSRNYNQVYYIVWDVTSNQYKNWYGYPVSTEQIKTVDYALECYDGWNNQYSLHKTVTDFYALNEYGNTVNLRMNFEFKNHISSYFYDSHSESYYYSGGHKVSLDQWKTKK